MQSVELSLSNDVYSIPELIGTLDMWGGDVKLYCFIAAKLEWYVRSFQRYRILKTLDKAGISVNIAGKGWDFAGFKNHKILSAVSYDNILGLMKRSKIVLNVSFPYYEGAHERIFSSMLNGACVLTNPSSFLKRDFSDGNNLFYYDWLECDVLPEKVNVILSNNSRIGDVSRSAMIIAREKHMWKNRAEELSNLMKKTDYYNRKA